MLYHTIFVLTLILLKLTLCSHYIFFSISQAAENSHFSSFLSSLAYLSTGLTIWNFDLTCLSFIFHFISFIQEGPTEFETSWLQEIPFSKELTDNYW